MNKSFHFKEHQRQNRVKGTEEPVRRLGIQTGSALKSDSEHLTDNKSTSDCMKPPEKAKHISHTADMESFPAWCQSNTKVLTPTNMVCSPQLSDSLLKVCNCVFIIVTVFTIEPKIRKVTRQHISLEFLI